jgi:transcriptional regulator with XRE-family HTH domain
MKINKLPQRLGLTQTEIAQDIGTTLSTLNDYMTGRRGKTSTVVEKLCLEYDLYYEEVFFQDRVETFHVTSKTFNLAIEGLILAAEAGADKEACEKLIALIKQLADDSAGDDDPVVG